MQWCPYEGVCGASTIVGVVVYVALSVSFQVFDLSHMFLDSHVCGLSYVGFIVSFVLSNISSRFLS